MIAKCKQLYPLPIRLVLTVLGHFTLSSLALGRFDPGRIALHVGQLI